MEAISAGSGRDYPSLSQLHAASLSVDLLSANSRSFAFEQNKELTTRTAFSPPGTGIPYRRQFTEQRQQHSSSPGAGGRRRGL